MPEIIKSYHVIAVNDLKASTRYYQEVLGFEVKEIGGSGCYFYDKDSCRILTGECPEALAPAQIGDHSYFAYLVVAGIDNYFSEVSDAGAEILKPLTDEPWGMREFALRTIDGHRIMVGEESD